MIGEDVTNGPHGIEQKHPPSPHLDPPVVRDSLAFACQTRLFWWRDETNLTPPHRCRFGGCYFFIELRQVPGCNLSGNTRIRGRVCALSK